MPELYAFLCGSTTIPRSFMIDGAAGEITVPVPAFLVVHPRGSLVFDTGFNQLFRTDPTGYVPDGYFDTRQVHLAAADALDVQMRAAGFDPAGVSRVVNSHLHYDHCGGNAAFPGATVVVQEAEWRAAVAAPDDLPAYRKVDFLTGQDTQLVDGDVDLFGDGSVVALATSGHTPGHQSLLVRRGERDAVVLTADACYLERHLRGGAVPGLRADAAGFTRSLERIRGFEQRGAVIAFGHDPEFWAAQPLGPAPLLTG